MLASFNAASAARTLFGPAKDGVLVKKEVHFADDVFRADLDTLPTRLTYARVQLYMRRLPAIDFTCLHSTLYLRVASSPPSVAKHDHIMRRGATQSHVFLPQQPTGTPG